MGTVSTPLNAGERVIATAKLHPGAVIAPLVVALIGAVLGFARLSPALDQLRVIGILLLVVGLWMTLMALAARRSTKFVLTDERMIGESGLSKRKEMTIFIRNLDSIQVKRPVLGMLFGYGTLIVNARGQGNLRVEYPQIANPDKMADLVRVQMALPGKSSRATV